MTKGWPSHRSLDGGIDEITLPGVSGRLWLCGKHLVGPDPLAAMLRVSASVVVCLNEAHELDARYPEYVAWLARESAVADSDGAARWYPIPDLHAPDLVRFRTIVGEIVSLLRAGDGVIVHCGAGIGRAGTTAVGVLMELGTPLEEAVEQVRAQRPMAGPEAGTQQDLLVALAEVTDRR